MLLDGGAPVVAFGDGGSFCASQPATKFCRSFDDGDVKAGWDRVDSRGDFSLGPFESAPFSAIDDVLFDAR